MAKSSDVAITLETLLIDIHRAGNVYRKDKLQIDLGFSMSRVSPGQNGSEPACEASYLLPKSHSWPRLAKKAR